MCSSIAMGVCKLEYYKQVHISQMWVNVDFFILRLLYLHYEECLLLFHFECNKYMAELNKQFPLSYLYFPKCHRWLELISSR